MSTAKKKIKKPNVYKEVAASFEQLTKHAEHFLKPQPEKCNAIKDLIQQTYAISISGDDENKKEILPELVLEDMDEEQIWQQLEIRNELVLAQLIKQTAELTALKEQHLGIELEENEDEEQEDDEEEEEEKQAEEKAQKLKSMPAPGKETKTSKKIRSSVVDDEFFKLNEMKQFLEQEDAKEMRRLKSKSQVEDVEGVDFFSSGWGMGESDDEEEEGNADYRTFFGESQRETLSPRVKQRDFFNEDESDDADPEADDLESEERTTEVVSTDAKKQQHMPDDQTSEIDDADFVTRSGIEPADDSECDDNEDDDNDSNSDDHTDSQAAQSSNDLREARLMQRIRDYEEIVLGEKPWQLKGEVQAANRPQNSLLEEILEFDSTTRPAAAITEEDNRTIEEMIKQRIRDRAWDDVERTVRPVHTPQEYRKQLVLDQEKSKESLAQVYEKEYQRELDKLDPNRQAGDESNIPEPKEHQEIRRALRTLFLKLDALSNFHFTPKPVAPEIKVVTNTPAVQMEEVAPVAVSDAKLLAPEEVYRGPKHAPLGKEERTRTDKNRERRKKKQKQRAINAAVEAREQTRAKLGKAPTQRHANAKLLKSITKSRNVQQITSSNDQSALKSSKAFFNKLQDTTASTVVKGKKRPEKNAGRANAKKLKL
ncbi:U3 small nucleolar ribonucleoprotein protein MPP10 [Scaptodrosophila lebanonensis]|uniref:U3 small nucleolar ribonucleoprotein protein MPP10 n=1 Tax=Drosophila lebanonensis TaxID=7225 RepID=A0A6J2TWH9_DROLE|nr:U3 small nucleolar ribonucleoprotein protein MPP10 [Scaptodrosophila lebanonensis]